MTDKVQKIRKELLRLKEETSIGLSEHENGVEHGRMEILNALSIFLDSMQKEPQVKESAKVQHIDETCKDNGNSLTQEPISKELEKSALLYYPKMSRISEPHGIIPADNESHYIGDANEDNRKAFKAGAKWQKEHQMIANAIDGKVIANGMGKPILHLWDKGKHLIDKKVKVILIKEE